MQQDSNVPSAPPEDAFEYINEGMKNANEGIKDKDFIIPNDMPIPDAIQQQLIYQTIIEQQKQNKNDASKQPSLEEKQPPKQQSIPQPKPSFMAQNIHYPESALYKTAGICVWRQKENGKGIQFMMGLEKNSNTLSFFGGKRDKSDGTCIDTAVREFDEETANKLDKETLHQIKQMLASDKERCLFWKKEWHSVLYYYQMAYDYGIVKDYNNICGWNAEMKSIFWIDFEKLYHSVFIHGNPIKISKNRYSLRSFVVGLLLHQENKKYLMDLHLKYGGNMEHIQPKKGGTIRNTLTSFKNIPKALRLDIIHPITHNVLYHRWIEMDILQIEDYQLLLSLISSICPEIGRNFMLYYTENKYFRTSKTQYNIDTIPSFDKLQSLLSSKRHNYITQIAVLPTFIVSDNFKGIPLSFKAQNVSWKHIHTNNDDEKSALSFIYNKANEWAQSWFADEDEDEDDDDNDMLWKWQFMNDSNKYQDFNNTNTKHIEKCFILGQSFTNFKRKNVTYQVNYKTLMQKNLNTSKLRGIRRVPSSVQSDWSSDMIKPQNIEFYKWQYMDDNSQWIDYDTSISKRLNRFRNNVQHHRIYYGHQLFESQCTMNANIENKTYLIDVWNFKQKNTSTSKQRSVRRIPVYENGNYYQPLFMNDNKYKWQYKDGDWTDYDDKTSGYIEKQYISNSFCSPFIITSASNQSYNINFKSMQQQSLSSGKLRNIQRISVIQNVIKHRWEWIDDDGTYKRYDNYTSSQIETAANSGIKKYFFVSSKNNNSYEINFVNMTQYNVKTGKQRKVRKVLLLAKWNGIGPNPKDYTGPKGVDRRTFGSKVCDLYCIVGDNVAKEVKKSGKLIRATLGPFGAALYLYDSIFMAKQMAKDRSICNKGNIINAKVFVGKQYDVSNYDDKEYDFISMQKNGNDSISRALGFGTEYIVYNTDQVCIVKVEKYNN